MKSNIIVLKGLPASGKSTWAKEFVSKNPGWFRVNKDDLRSMMHEGKWSKGNEKQVLLVRDASINAALACGYNVIVDDTNFAPQHIEVIKNIADQHNANFEVKYFDVPLVDCLVRNQTRTNRVPEHVIIDMYNKYVFPAKPKAFNNIKLPLAVVCDLDGTLAIHENRSPYEFHRCQEDGVNSSVLHCINMMKAGGHRIIFVSGREDSCRDNTIKWLEDECSFREDLDYLIYMRKTGDKRKDSILKQEIYEREILPNFYIDFVLDDRQQVVDSLREMGLRVWQVARGDF